MHKSTLIKRIILVSLLFLFTISCINQQETIATTPTNISPLPITTPVLAFTQTSEISPTSSIIGDLINLGPQGGLFRDLVIDTTSGTLYVVTFDGVFKSTDNGENWRAINNGLIGKGFSKIIIDPLIPTTLYLCSYGDSLFKSTNGGENWYVIDTEIEIGGVANLVINPLLPNILYTTTNGSGVYKSIDGGENWTQTNLSKIVF